MDEGKSERRRHPRQALSDARCRAVTKGGKYADGQGLFLLVDGDGGPKRWLLRIVVEGRRRDLSLGSYPDVGLADARREGR